MNQKKVNLTLIFSLILFGIGIAIKSLSNYFSGFGIPFVAVIVIAVLMLVNGFKNYANRRRLLDVFILAGVSIIFALIAYCSYDWVNQLELTFNDVEFINEWCIAYSIFSTIFLVYGLLRYISETSDKKWNIFEYILGLKKVEKKKVTVSEKYNRQPKEVMNGDLEQKPNQTEEVKEEKAENEKVEEQLNNDSNINKY